MEVGKNLIRFLGTEELTDDFFLQHLMQLDTEPLMTIVTVATRAYQEREEGKINQEVYEQTIKDGVGLENMPEELAELVEYAIKPTPEFEDKVAEPNGTDFSHNCFRPNALGLAAATR
jgi:hypothetical protein